MDRIEKAIVKLNSNQLNLIIAQTAMATKLDELLQRLALLDTTQHTHTHTHISRKVQQDKDQ